MTVRPGSQLARRPLHFFVIADCSGSMASDGKIQALNNALRETIPHLTEVAAQNPHAEVLIRVLAFSTGARWHLSEPTPVDDVQWQDLSAGGYSDLGAALKLLTPQLQSPVMPDRALPPAMVLVSDGMPTDDYRTALARMLDEPWGQRAVRMAVGIGRDAERSMLSQFMGSADLAPVSANNPEQLVSMIRWASMYVSRVASELASPPPEPFGPMANQPSEDGLGDVW